MLNRGVLPTSPSCTTQFEKHVNSLSMHIIALQTPQSQTPNVDAHLPYSPPLSRTNQPKPKPLIRHETEEVSSLTKSCHGSQDKWHVSIQLEV